MMNENVFGNFRRRSCGGKAAVVFFPLARHPLNSDVTFFNSINISITLNVNCLLCLDVQPPSQSPEANLLTNAASRDNWIDDKEVSPPKSDSPMAEINGR
jgi:hypothetical protein